LDPLKQIKLHYIKLAAYYGVNLPDEVLCLYAKDLVHLPPEQVEHIMGILRLRLARLPRPGDILAALNAPGASSEAQANEVAARIWKALGTDGYTNAQRAQKRIGPIGWEVVERLGGWQGLCLQTEHQARGTFFAQCRQLALATLERQAHQTLMLGSPQQTRLLATEAP
jgi:hypothetical protein